jgi:hypothetical protein
VYITCDMFGSQSGSIFHLFFYSPRGGGIRVDGSCRARGIANILLIISSLLVRSPVPSPGPLIVSILMTPPQHKGNYTGLSVFAIWNCEL